MARITRRGFLRGVASGVPLWVARPRWASATPTTTAPRHHTVLIHLSGGYDAVGSVDPKAGPDAVDIDPGYRADDRLRGKVRLYGPLMKELMPIEDALTLVHGVRVDTVSHEDGTAKVLRGHSLYGPSTPLGGDVVGAATPGTAPIESLVLKTTALPLTTRTSYPTGVGLGPEVTQAVLRGELVRPRRSDPAIVAARIAEAQRTLAFDPQAAAQAARNIRNGDALRDLLRTIPTRTPFQDPELGHRLHMALHAIRTNAARFITIVIVPSYLDTHADHVRVQHERLPSLFADLTRFVRALTADGLDKVTTLAVSSEVGRYPKFNLAMGKDHWPEQSWILWGAGLKPGATIGGTDPKYQSRAVDYRTGAFTGDQTRPIFVDQIYATLLKATRGSFTGTGYVADDALDAILA